MPARSGVKWTKDEVVYVLTSDKSDGELADELDRSVQAISAMRANLKRGYNYIPLTFKDKKGA